MKNIIRPKRIFYDDKKPYILFKKKKYYLNNLDNKYIINLIKKLSKKIKRKKIENKKKIKKDVNKSLTGIITSKIYEGYVNNQLTNKLDNINKDIIDINKKINDNKKMIKYVDDNKDKLKNYDDNDLYILNKNGKYRFYLNNKQYLEEDDKNKLKSIVFNTYKDYIKLKKDNENLSNINDSLKKGSINNISKINYLEDYLNNVNNNIRNEIDDLYEKNFYQEIYINEYIEPKLQNIEQQKEQQIKKVKRGRPPKLKKTSKKILEDFLKNVSPEIKNQPILIEENKNNDDNSIDYGDGLNKYLENKGTYSTEIKEIMKNVKYFIDVISIDDLNTLVDKIIKHKLYKCCFIMNLKTDDNNKYHWVSVYIDLINDMEINYYDCLGIKAPKIFKDAIDKLINKLNIDVYVKFKENLIKNQPDYSFLCAYYCISFILQRLSGLDFKYITNYKNMNEKNIKELKQKYEKFKFI
jgi:hypothetical protein